MFRFKGEVYPLVVLENAVANEQKLTTLMSSSGRISYSASNFLRFWRPGFIEEPAVLESKDRLQGRMRVFSKDMMGIYGEKKDIFKESTEYLLNRNGFVYEEDLYGHVFGGKEKTATEAAFAVHKFLFEGADGDRLIKDGQWSVSEKSSGPYVLRPQWQLDLLHETAESIKNEKDLRAFKAKVLECIKTKKPLKPESKLEGLLMQCLKAFSEEFYVNVIGTLKKNPFKELLDEALLGVAIVDSQAQAKELFQLLSGEIDVIDYNSKPLVNSFIGTRPTLGTFNINMGITDCDNLVDFGELPVYLIDPKGTVEVDDGISVERVYGNDKEVILHVHVADPSNLVFDESVEREAQRRAETVYLAERKISMLPEQVTILSTLKMSDDKMEGIRTLTFSCRIDLESGDISDQKIRSGLIRNLKHFTYEEAGLVANDPDLELMKQIAKAHLKYRTDQGHLDISFPRGVARIDRDKRKLSVDIEGAEDITGMKHVVAEAMIIAGRIAGDYLKAHSLAAPFRSHSLPAQNRDFKLDTLLQKYEILKHLSGAEVDLKPKRHESMGLEAYVKVTSPLRRYLDLVTHRILKRNKDDSSLTGDFLRTIHRQEVYNKRLRMNVNKFWIERYIWQRPFDIWTLIPLEKLKEGMWTVHVEEVASNFMVQLNGKNSFDLGERLKARLIGKPHESILRFECVL